MIFATGEDHNLTTKGWCLSANNSVSDNNYRHVELRHADDATASFERYPVQPAPFPTSTLSNIKVFEKNESGELWGIFKDGNGAITTFFKKDGVYDHWVASKVKTVLSSFQNRIASKIQNGYTSVTENAYWDADKRIVCFANGYEINT